MPRRLPLPRFGLGDLIVLASLALLAVLAATPHLRGRRLAGRELRARDTLDRLVEGLESSGLAGAYARTMAALEARAPGDGELRPFDEHQSPLAWFAPLLEDDDYVYRIDPFRAGVAAHPKRPWASGRDVLAVDAGGALSRTRLPAPPEGVASETLHALDKAEALAAANVQAIAETMHATGLAAHAKSFRTAIETLAASLELAIASADAGPPAGFEAHGRHYGYRIWPLHGSGWQLECYAWPLEPGRSGFAAFRRAGTSVLQSRNKVFPYDERRRPMPGAALLRPGARDDGQGFTGFDGNRWFPFGPAGS